MGINIRENVISGIKWGVVGQFGRQIISFGVSLILARILLPSEFGIIGIILVFTGIAEVFVNAGLGVALIQRKENSLEDYSTVFFFNIIVSCFFYVLMFLCAPIIASFYKSMDIDILLKLTGLVFVFNAFGTVQNTILSIQLNFKLQNLISIFSVLISSLFTLTLAYLGYGIYSLVWQILIMSLVSNISLWLLSEWRPKFTFSIESFKILFSFGSKILVSSILDKIFSTVDSLIVGKVFSISNLGFFTRARSTKDLPIVNSTNIISSIYFPIFSKLTDPIDLRRYHLKFFSLINFIILPVCISIFVLAEPIVIFLYTNKWKEAIPMLQIFSLYGFVYPLSVILVQSILIRGNSTLFLKLDVYKKVILLISMIWGGFYGILPFMIFVCIGNYICFFINLYYTAKLLDIDLLHYFRLSFKTILISVIMGVVVYFVNFDYIVSSGVILFFKIFISIVIFSLLSIVFKIKDLDTIKYMISKKALL